MTSAIQSLVLASGERETLPVPFKTYESFQARLVRWSLLGIGLAFFTLVLFLPLLAIFSEALKKGWEAYSQAIIDEEAMAALRLSLSLLAVSVPLNTIFGLAAAWTISKFEFRGKRLLVTLVDLPLAVSPVIAGLVFVLLFGSQGWWGDWLSARGIKVLFAFPSMALATTFITVPFVVKQLLPLMEAQGTEEEEAAALLGAGGWQSFWHVTLPNIRWALFHGIVLCTARGIGEFGAVSVVSGHIRGLTNSLPLHIEILYNEYHFVSAYAVASLLAAFSLITLGLKLYFERKTQESSR